MGLVLMEFSRNLLITVKGIVVQLSDFIKMIQLKWITEYLQDATECHPQLKMKRPAYRPISQKKSSLIHTFLNQITNVNKPYNL